MSWKMRFVLVGVNHELCTCSCEASREAGAICRVLDGKEHHHITVDEIYNDRTARNAGYKVNKGTYEMCKMVLIHRGNVEISFAGIGDVNFIPGK